LVARTGGAIPAMEEVPEDVRALSGSGGRIAWRINGDDTVMVDGGVGDSDDSGLRSIDLATLSGVLRVCDVELLLLDGNGPRAAFASRVHEEALFCSISCGFHCRGRFMLPPDWAMLGYLHATDETLSWCHGVPLAPGWR
jgi:AraC family ethanolamine operon transcriptional activator